MGRGDAMCAALGFAAIAAYLWIRERNLLLSVFISQFLVVLSGLTHFLGLLPFVGLLFLIIYLDRQSITWKLILTAATPYIIGGIAFGIWVLQDPIAFRDQFLVNALMHGRMEGMSSPLGGLVKEFTYRYPRAFGLLNPSAGHTGPIYLKSLILAGYVIGVLGMIFTKRLRNNVNFRILLTLMLIYFTMMALLDGQKLSAYLIYIVPFYSVLLAIWVHEMWTTRTIFRPFLFIGIAGLLALQTGGIALRSRQNTYSNHFLPAVKYLNMNAGENELIMGSAELQFALKPSLNHIADGQFGLHTGKRPKYIVFDPGVEDSLNNSKTYNPEFFEYFPRLLEEEYVLGYRNEAFKVYVRK